MRLLPRPGPALPISLRAAGGDHPVTALTTPLAGRSLGERLARKEHLALEELYDACAGRAFGLAYRLLGDGPAAEDIVHDAFLWIWEHSDRIDASRGDGESLLLTVTHRRSIDQLRKRARQTATQRDAGYALEPLDEAALTMLADIETATARTRLREALLALGADQREVVELAFYGGMTHQQIAEARDLPLGTVKSRLRLAMERLRAALTAEEIR